MTDFAYTGPCGVVADLVVEVAPPLVCAAGVYTTGGLAAPKACGPWLWLNTNPGYKAAIKTAVDLGCQVTVEWGDDAYRIIVSASSQASKRVKNAAHRAGRTYRTLNTPAGAMWLHRRLSSF